MEVDVLVVGAGPAGSTTARYCAGKGQEVLVIDRRKEIGYPIQCGEFLPAVKELYSMFPRTMDLEELFISDESLISGESSVVGFVSPKGKVYRCDFEGVILDRRAFDKHLAKLAVEAGARLEIGTSFLSMANGVAKTTMGDVKAKVVVGADGPNSRTARQAGLCNAALRYPAVTCQAEGAFDPEIMMYFGAIAPGGYAWVIPKRSGANIGVGAKPSMMKEKPTELFERFVRKLGISYYRDLSLGFVPQSGPVSKTVSGNTILVGDAAGHVMASNGGGIPIAMIAARIAGRTIREHLTHGTPLTEYERRWRAVMERPLADALWTRRLSDLFLPSDRRTEFAMRVLGKRGLSRAIRCSRVFYIF